MEHLKKHLVSINATVREVLAKLEALGKDAILFLIDAEECLIGTLTDGDIRRGLIKGLDLETPIQEFIQASPKYFRKDEFSLEQMQDWRSRNFRIIPVVNDAFQIIDIVNFRLQKSYLPIDAVIMAGGKGTRLRPLTLTTPKPLLKVGGKPIIEYNIDRLGAFGIKNQTISLNYLGEQLEDYFGDGSAKKLSIRYVSEEKPLGTIGAVSLVPSFENDYVLVMNSDILTNISYENFFKEMIDKKADMIVATTPYEVKIPYGIIETEGELIASLREKPTYTYYSNAGIYIVKKEHVGLIPKDSPFNAPDLMAALIEQGKRVVHYPILGYWLDIGKPDDFEKAQKDIKHISF